MTLSNTSPGFPPSTRKKIVTMIRTVSHAQPGKMAALLPAAFFQLPPSPVPFLKRSTNPKKRPRFFLERDCPRELTIPNTTVDRDLAGRLSFSGLISLLDASCGVNLSAVVYQSVDRKSILRSSFQFHFPTEKVISLRTIDI